MKITDKMRLDWLRKNPRGITYYGLSGLTCDWGNDVNPYGHYKTPRQAIDAAIRQDRKGKV